MGGISHASFWPFMFLKKKTKKKKRLNIARLNYLQDNVVNSRVAAVILLPPKVHFTQCFVELRAFTAVLQGLVLVLSNLSLPVLGCMIHPLQDM